MRTELARPTLLAALKKRYRTPREVLAKLGLDQSLLDIPRLAFDAALPGTSAKMQLEEMLCEVLSGHQLQRVRDLLHSIDEDDGEADNDEFEQQEAEDEEDNEAELRERRRKMMSKIADFLSTKKGLSEDEIAGTLSDFPRPGLEHLGGALAEDLEQLMKDRRRRMTHDVKKRALAADRASASLLRHFPEARRLYSGSPLEAGFSGAEGEQRLAMDAAAANGDSFAEMFPEAARIGIA